MLLMNLDITSRLQLCETCTKFRPFLYEQRLWHHVDLTTLVVVPKKVLRMLTIMSKYIKHLNIAGVNVTFPENFPFERLLTKMKTLEYLDMSGSELVLDVPFLRHMQKLKSLIMNDCTLLGTTSVRRYMRYCKNLRYLSAKRVYQLQALHLVVIVRHLKKLEHIDVLQSMHFMPDQAQCILRSCTKLHTFSFSAYWHGDIARPWVVLLAREYPNVNYHHQIVNHVRFYIRYYMW